MVDRAASPAPKRKIVIQEVKVRNFGRIESLDLDLDPAVNIVVGQNASGKTMLLELIALVLRQRNFPARFREVPGGLFKVEISINDGLEQQSIVADLVPRAGLIRV